MNRAQPITVLVGALGGEGGGVLAEWLYDTAVHSGHSAQATSIPGVAQRTGATTYYIEVFPLPNSALGGRRPVFSLNAVPGAIDLLVSSELLETVRQIGNGFASADRTLVVSSSSRALTVVEKMHLGDGRLDEAALLTTVQRHAQACEVLDMAALARASGTVISAVLLGAIAASGRLPFARAAFEDAIRRSGKGVEASLRGFAAAFDAVVMRRAGQAQAEAPIETATRALPPELRKLFPAATHEIIALGHARVVDYQDDRYAAWYVQRLASVLEAERAADPSGAKGWAITREAARWLALWMAFDDIVRVAALKLRASRTERVRREVAAREDEIVKLFDHFKPGAPELAALLPAGLAQRLLAWDERRRAAGRAPWAMPLKIGTHTVLGTLALRCVAGLKGQRRRGSRFAVEQALIEHWLAALQRATREHWALGHEVAQCGRLIKGYGSTNERGKASLLHLIDHLAAPRVGADALHRAEAIHAAREAALGDDGGRALDQALAAHGAPPRPLRAQPIRWFKRRPGAETGAAGKP
ncbi:MAG: indolepyruvate oxidoreductase subunit beta family protein [Ideonella sp.]|nr:indolepyruvate oxidoreductase subunit beta family protein [Ideonella sp.]